MVDKIPVTFSATRLGFEVSKLHVLSCTYHFKCISEIKLVHISDPKVGRTGLGSDYVHQDYFNYFLFILVFF